MKEATNYRFYEDQRFNKGDIILILFGTKVPSTYRVLYANNKLKKLRVMVIEDTYEKPHERGSVLDISKAIFEQYWSFHLVKDVKPRGKVREDLP